MGFSEKDLKSIAMGRHGEIRFRQKVSLDEFFKNIANKVSFDEFFKKLANTSIQDPEMGCESETIDLRIVVTPPPNDLSGFNDLCRRCYSGCSGPGPASEPVQSPAALSVSDLQRRPVLKR